MLRGAKLLTPTRRFWYHGIARSHPLAMQATLLLEIGCEELPTSFLDSALEQLRTLVPEELSRARIPHGDVRVLGTPRRIAFLVKHVTATVPPREEELIGPPESAARTPDGQWSRAAEGFARKNNLTTDSLSITDTPRGRYLRALKLHPGASTVSQLPAVLSAICKRITFTRSMRWGDLDTAFGRPIQWLLARYGTELIRFDFAGVTSGEHTRGHRFLSPQAIVVPDADGYVPLLHEAHVLVDPDERRHRLVSGLESAAHAAGGELVRDDFLEREVLGLVEDPVVITGHFSPEFLSLPHALIQVVMRVHQRYFAVRKLPVAQGGPDEILPVFLTVANTALDPAAIRKGNEGVMRARLSDAAFFVAQDRKTSLASRVDSLDAVVFHQRLGSYGDKVRRLEALAPMLAKHLGADEVSVKQSATLCKADLVTLTVGEFPEMQGQMGAYFARCDGEADTVSAAIAEHHQPRSASDELPAGRAGAALAIADRIDTLMGCFAAGLRPTGSEDPFALRRSAMGALRVILHRRVHLSLSETVGLAWARYVSPAVPRSPGVFDWLRTVQVEVAQRAVLDFMSERLRGLLEERFAKPVVSACIAAGCDDPADVLDRVEALAAFWTSPAAADLAVAFRRVFNISREAPGGEPDLEVLTHPAEKALVEAFSAARGDLQPLLAGRQYTEALDLIARTLRRPIDMFFEQVFVMDQDLALRGARLRLLGRIADEVARIARFDALDDAPAAP